MSYEFTIRLEKWFTTMGISFNNKTFDNFCCRIQTPLAMDQWAWTRQQAVRYLGINMACGALVGVTCFGCIGPLAKKFDDRKLLIFVGLIPLIIGKIV